MKKKKHRFCLKEVSKGVESVKIGVIPKLSGKREKDLLLPGCVNR